jgi:hypothetical protein
VTPIAAAAAAVAAAAAAATTATTVTTIVTAIVIVVVARGRMWAALARMTRERRCVAYSLLKTYNIIYYQKI